jgi:hypothetical protein
MARVSTGCEFNEKLGTQGDIGKPGDVFHRGGCDCPVESLASTVESNPESQVSLQNHRRITGGCDFATYSVSAWDYGVSEAPSPRMARVSTGWAGHYYYYDHISLFV